MILLLPLTVFPQSSMTPQIKNEDGLISVLLSVRADQTSTGRILKDHPSLVTTHLWKKLTDRAAWATYDQSPERAVLIYEVAKEVALQLNDDRLVATTLYHLGRTYAGIGHMKKAIEAYLQSRKVFAEAGQQRDLIYILSDLSTLYLNLEDYKEAKECAQQSIAMAERLRNSNVVTGAWPDEYGVAGALSTLGEICLWEGDYQQALELLQKSLALYRQLDQGSAKYHIYIADDLAAIGRVYTTMGDNRQALLYLNRALEMARAWPAQDRVAGLFNSLGILYLEQGNYLKATEFLTQSLRIYQTQDKSIEVARILLNLGVAHQRQGSYVRALDCFHESLRKAHAIENTEITILAEEGIGAVYKDQGDYRRALEALHRGWGLAAAVNDQMRMAELLWRQSEVHLATGDYAQATAHAERAAQIAHRIHSPNVYYLASTTLGSAYLKQRRYELAHQALAQAIEQIESMRHQVAGHEQEQFFFFEKKVAAYHSMIELLIAQKRGFEALLYAEKAKGRVLLDVLEGGKVDLANKLTPQKKAEEQLLNQRIVALNKQIRNENVKSTPDATLLKNLYAQLHSARLQYESWQNVLYASHPHLDVQRGRTPALTFDGLNTLLQDHQTAFLEYVVTKEQVYLFVITKGAQESGPNIRVYSIDIIEEELIKKIDRFHKLMADRHQAYAAFSRELYDLLVKPAAQQLRGKETLCIIPDGVLWDVPFQALQPRDHDFLLVDYALYYAPSLSILKEMAKPKQGHVKRPLSSLIAFGNPSAGREMIATLQEAHRGERFDPLPDAETEVRTLEAIFGHKQSKVFVGTGATEQSFKLLAPAYQTIHLATHGVLDNLHPLYSYLLLSKAEGATDDDGLLEAREIMNLDLQADLAVLSACDTARGRIGAGEGVIGMSWAFFVAGCRTTIVSQWPVNSARTSQLMISFYQHLKSAPSPERITKAQALRRAALELMQKELYRHPFYWAGFVMIGSNR